MFRVYYYPNFAMNSATSCNYAVLAQALKQIREYIERGEGQQCELYEVRNHYEFLLETFDKWNIDF